MSIAQWDPYASVMSCLENISNMFVLDKDKDG